MAGILDFLQSPEAQMGIGLLAAGGPSTTPMNVGQRVQMAMQGMTANEQNKLKLKLMQSQIDENSSQDAMRKQQLAMSQRQMAMQNQLLGFGDTPSPTATAAASGVMPTTPPTAGVAPMIPNGAGSPIAGMPSAPPQQSAGTLDAMSRQYGIPAEALKYDLVFNGGKGIAEMVAKRGTPDMQVSNGYVYDKNKVGPGYLPQLNMSQDGKASMVRIGPDGLPVVSAPQGAVDTFSAYQGAQANFKPIKIFNPQTQREEFTSEGAVVAPRQPMARTGNPMIDAVIQTESGGNPNAVSPKGAQGLMQVMPGTNSAPGFGVAPAKDGSETERTRVGQEYLTALTQKYQNPTLAAIAYNWGPGNTDMWLKSGGDYNKLPAETKQYVSAVMTRSAVNGIGGQQAAPQTGNVAAGPSATEAATAKANEARMVDTAKADVVRDTGKTAEGKRAGQVSQISNLASQLLDQGPTASGVGSLVDAAANFVGQPLKGGTKAQQLEALSGWLVSNVPRMEGPQSNADVLNYQTMAGRVGDRTLPVEARKAALGTLMELQRKYAEAGSDTTAPNPIKPSKVLDALPTPNASNRGQRIRDTTTGKVLVSNGLQWKEE